MINVTVSQCTSPQLTLEVAVLITDLGKQSSSKTRALPIRGALLTHLHFMRMYLSFFSGFEYTLLLFCICRSASESTSVHRLAFLAQKMRETCKRFSKKIPLYCFSPKTTLLCSENVIWSSKRKSGISIRPIEYSPGFTGSHCQGHNILYQKPVRSVIGKIVFNNMRSSNRNSPHWAALVQYFKSPKVMTSLF